MWISQGKADLLNLGVVGPFPVFSRKTDRNIRSFEKGLAVRGGCCEEILPRPEIEASFVCRQPPPANPFSKPLKKQNLVNSGVGGGGPELAVILESPTFGKPFVQIHSRNGSTIVPLGSFEAIFRI